MRSARFGAVLSVVLIGACGGLDSGRDLFLDPPSSSGRGGSSTATGGTSAGRGGSSGKGGIGGSSGTIGGSAAGLSGSAGAGGLAGADDEEGGADAMTGGATSLGGTPSSRGGASAEGGAAGDGATTASGGSGVSASAGEGGSGDAGETGAGGASGSAGASGTAGAPSCAQTCGPNGTCTGDGPKMTCECHTGFVAAGGTCRRPISCRELHQVEPSLPSGVRALRPALASADIQSYCEMSAQGGGWTLVLNQGTSFDPSAMGSSAELGYESQGTNLSYSTVLLQSDVMIDVRIGAITAQGQTARATIIGVHQATRDRTVRDLVTLGPNYLEAEDNSNLTLESTIGCSFSPTALSPLFCQSCTGAAACTAPVVVFGAKPAGCDADPVFAISGAASYSEPWDDCAGWPQAIALNGQQRFPNNFRIWIR